MSKKYTKDHEWIAVDGNQAAIGITDYAQGELGDIVFIELPESGKTIAAQDEIAVVESVKAASEIYAPIGGTIIETNTTLVDNPGLMNSDPEGQGWIVKIEVTNLSELDALMDASAYADYVQALEG